MAKKQNKTILWIAGLIILFIILSKGGFINFGELAITPTSGAQPIINIDTGKNEYIIDQNSFSCDADECLVKAKMELVKPSSQNYVKFKWIDKEKEIAFLKSDTDDNLKRYKFSVSFSTNRGYSNCDILTKEGWCVKYTGYRDEIEVWTERNSGKRFKKTTTDPSLTDIKFSKVPSLNCQDPEYCVKLPSYEGEFNFCPRLDLQFSYCSGVSNKVSSVEPKTYISEEVKLLFGQSVDFNPKYSDNSDIIDRFIIVSKYDLSCIPAIKDKRACTPDQIQCSSSCPSGYTLFQSGVIYCGSGDFGSYQSPTASVQNSICHQSSNQYQWAGCKKPSSTIYNKCESTQKIGNSQCGNFGTKNYEAPIGQQCFLLDSNGKLTNQQGVGLGGLACPSSVQSGGACALGAKSGVDGSSNYNECVLVGQCNQQITKSCPSDLRFQLVFDSKKINQAIPCSFPKSVTCEPLSASCVNNKEIKKCVQATVQGISDYVFQENPEECSGELACLDKEGYNDLCSCTNINEAKVKNSLGEDSTIKCTSTKTYLSYSQEGPNTCFKYRDKGNILNIEISTQECINNEIKQRSDIGCASGTTGFECSVLEDSNKIKLEQCIDNQCKVIEDQFSASANQFSDGATRCSTSKSNTVEKVERIIDGTKIFHRWITKTDAENSVNGICNSDYSCTQSGNTAKCLPGFQFVGIIAEKSYGVGIPINGVKVLLTDSYPGGKSSKQITARLLDNGVEVPGTRIVTLTNSIGEKLVDFNYAHIRTGKLTIEVIAGDPATSNYKSIKQIDITKRLKVKLSCPSIGYINRDILCNYLVQDRDNNQLVGGYSPKINVNQGQNQILTDSSLNSIKFMSGTSGSVIVKVEATKEGFISDSEQSAVEIQTPQVTQTFKIDNQEYSTVGNSLEIGYHQFALTFDEVGIPSDVNSIQAVIREPSGREVPIIFTKQIGGLAISNTIERWITSYNLQQAGSNYEIKGVTYFSDITKSPQPFSFTVNTLGSKTEEDKSTFNLFIILGAVFLVLVIIIIVIIFLVRRRSRN